MDAVSTPMDLILPASPSSDVGALYLGSLFAFFDPERLTSHSIGIENMEMYQVDILDSVKVDLKPHLEAAIRWIDERLMKVVNVLVHCQEGVLRSTSVVIAYLIHTQNMSYDDALVLVKRRRACVKPNRGFARCVKASRAALCSCPSYPKH
ncbi:dual specificity phosphatase [Irpex lacteus]|nr:dual specificity phosphatase [Irpex lacteus]